MPEDAKMESGTSVSDITEDTFVPHLKQFKEMSGITYPFVVGDKKDFENYHVTGIPTVVVVGVDGKIQLVSIGSGSEPLVRATVNHALSKL